MDKSYAERCSEMAGMLRTLLIMEQCSETMRRELTDWLKEFDEYEARLFQKLQKRQREAA